MAEIKACPAYKPDMPPKGWCQRNMGEWCLNVKCGRHDGRSVSFFQKEIRGENDHEKHKDGKNIL